MFLRTNGTPASMPRALTPAVASYALDTSNASNGVRSQQAWSTPATPAGVTSAITPADGSGLKNLVAAVSATVGGLSKFEYTGSAPGMVAGIAQVNVRIPVNAQSGFRFQS